MTAETKWTPGPWQWHAQGDANNYCILSADKTRWIIGFLQNGELMTATQEANAQLMSAAPEMASALVDALAYINADALNDRRQAKQIRETIHAALRKAGAL